MLSESGDRREQTELQAAIALLFLATGKGNYIRTCSSAVVRYLSYFLTVVTTSARRVRLTGP